jgi:hypothetical protein
MSNTMEGEELFIGTLEVDDRAYNVTVFIEHDGIEHVGHLWFSEADWDDDEGVRDQGTIPGRTPNEIVENARALSRNDLTLRFRRAQAQRRQFHGLRHATQEVLAQIRYLNTVATSMRAGLLDVEEAASEIANTERRLHEMVGQLRTFAGVAT